MSSGHTTGWRSRVPSVLAGVLAVVALLSVLAAISYALRAGMHAVTTTVNWLLVPVPANLAYATFVAILAAAVARRKRIAWWILVVFFSLQLITDGITLAMVVAAPEELAATSTGQLPAGLTEGLVGNGAVTVLMLAVLLVSKREFYASVQRASVAKALGVVAGMAVVSIALGWGLVSLFPGTLPAEDRLPYTVQKVFGGVVRFGIAPDARAPGWVSLILGLLGGAMLIAGLLTLFRSQRAQAVLAAKDEQQLRHLLAEHGYRDSLGYFATRRDKAAKFSPTGKAAVTYRVEAGVSLASGDPIGEPTNWPQAIDAWLAEARRQAWTPAVMGASEEGATAYAAAGLKVIELGDEAVIEVRRFTLEGRDMRPVRQAVNRVERLGYTARVRRHSTIPPAEMAEVIEVADRWRDTDAERGFSMALSRLGDPLDGDCVLIEALRGDGTRAAELSFVPWGPHGLSLDLMRRAPDADNGVMEFMVSELVKASPRLGVERVSLNFAMFRAVFEQGARIGAGPVLRLWRRLLLFFSRWWQLESLYRSNVKYRPDWQPRYLCFGERRELAKVGLASGIAEGFVVLPWRRGASGEPQPGRPDVEPVSMLSTASHDRAPNRIPEQMRVRLGKIERLRDTGITPYPVTVPRTDLCGEIAERHHELPPNEHTGERVAAAGRVLRVRDHGQLCFATIRDWSGDLQVMLGPDARLDDWKRYVDIGDHVSFRGEVVTSAHGELSVLVVEWTIAAKCLRPLPDKHRGLSDPEARVRQRYLDLAVNSEARRIMRARSAVVHTLRQSLHNDGFLEVETPILQPVHGGANARPFLTHINAYDMDLYLRIAPELFLKRLCVGGVEKVFELGRTFRNEGVSFKHNPEFTMLEAYWAYADYMDMRRLVQSLIQQACLAANGSMTVRRGDDEIDLSGEWPVVPLYQAVSKALGEEVTPDDHADRLRLLADAADVPYNPEWGHGAMMLELYERLVEHETTVPTFYSDFPTEVSPLTREHREDPRLAERWDLVAFGTEIGTAYSELIDPTEQRRRLTEQSLLAAGGDPEAMELDEDFLHALEYAMPPTGGLGIGVDRLVMLLTDRTIRETLPFPLVRPTGN